MPDIFSEAGAERRRFARFAVAALCAAATLIGCASPRLAVPHATSEAWPSPEETTLGRAFGEQIADRGGQSGFRLLVSGMEAFSIRAGLAESAERTLDLQYYLVREDTTTQILLYRVLRAARRDVRVRLLIDDLYALGRDFDLATFSAHPNIEVRVFNPFVHRGALGLSQLLEFVGDSTRLNRRMHNKLWIADNAAAIVGGRNLGDEYFDLQSEVNCYDLDILAAGPVVRDISRSFDNYWNSEWAVPIEAFVATPPDPERLAKFERALESRPESFRDTDYARVLRETSIGRQLRFGQLALTPASASAVYDEAAKISASGDETSPDPIFSRMRTTIEAAQREVIVISPYFIPSEQGIGMLSALTRRGIRVRILVNSLASTDFVPVAHAGYARFRARLLAAGLELYEMRPGPLDTIRSRHPGASSEAYLHTKAIIVDGRHVIVGSMNHDPRSRLLNTEVALFLESPEIGARLVALFEEAVRPARAFRLALTGTRPEQMELIWIAEQDGQEVRYHHEPAGFWRRFVSTLLSIFVPEVLL